MDRTLKLRLVFLNCLMLLASACSSLSAPSPSPKDEFAAAQSALESYLAALNSGDFQLSARLYAGPLDDLRYMNPEMDPLDEAALLEAGCLINGLQCLALRRVTSVEQVDEGVFRFTVEFSNPDGSLFVLGPCCGASETEIPSRAIFGLTVRAQGDEYFVVDLPPYVP